MEAVSVWRQFPTEIESALLDSGIDIADWHQSTRDEQGRLKLSSRRLVGWVKTHMDVVAAKNSALNGDWALDRHLMARLVNLSDKLLEAYYMTHSTEEDPSTYEAFIFRSPAQQREADRKEREEELQREEDDQHFYADMIGNGVS
jgi:hypothetical protein